MHLETPVDVYLLPTLQYNLICLILFPDGLTVACDISEDEELFMGQGDYQFDIYRLMRVENRSVSLSARPVFSLPDFQFSVQLT